MTAGFALVLFLAFVVLVVFSLFVYFIPVGLWISAMAANVKVSLANLIGMRLRRVRPQTIVLPLIKATKAGLGIDISKLEAHFWPAVMWTGWWMP